MVGDQERELKTHARVLWMTPADLAPAKSQTHQNPRFVVGFGVCGVGQCLDWFFSGHRGWPG